MKILTACGNDCALCPRYNTTGFLKSETDLHNTALLWYKLGYRDRVVSNDEINCTGCKIENFCRYEIIACVIEKELNNCGECSLYPCEKSDETFKKIMLFEPRCKETCTTFEYEMLKTAFFEKEKNLNEVANKKLHNIL